MSINEITQHQKSKLYSAIVWLLSGLFLLIYCLIGFLNVSIPGVEDLVLFLSTIEGKYIYLAVFISMFIEGLYFIGSFFPGSTLVVIMAIFSQVEGFLIFIQTIIFIFLGWCLAGFINILLSKIYHLKVIKLQTNNKYRVRDRLWATWSPTLRANYEVSQIIEGGNLLKVFLSSVRVKLWLSIIAALFMLIIPFFININEISNREGFIPVVIVAVISFIVGIVKLKKYFKSIKVSKNKTL